MEQIELKSCPFCGSKPRITIGLESGLAVAECVTDNCPAEYTENEFDMWNARASCWISVDDKLPAKEICCDVWLKNHFGDQVRACNLHFNGKYWFAEEYEFIDILKSGTVTHWMPVPQQPGVKNV